MKLDFDPVTDAAVFPFEGRDQRLFWELEAEWKLVSPRGKDSRFAVIWEETKEKKKKVSDIYYIACTKVQRGQIKFLDTRLFMLVSHGLHGAKCFIAHK